MKEIVFGTTNEQKIKQIRAVLASINIKVKGINKEVNLPKVEENGETAIENAQQKAIKYAQFFGEPVLSMDNALYFDNLEIDKQPGVNVRRVKGREERLSDDQMREYYSQLIEELGGKIGGYWEFGICIATPEGKIWKTTIKSPRIFVSKICEKSIDAYPLESIQIEPESGKYIAEMTQYEQDIFWLKTIGKPLIEFIETVKV